jgi:serine/threonine protein kinase
MPATDRARAPRIEVGTALADEPAKAAEFAAEVAAMEVDPAIWTGAFATNVWGGRYEIDDVLAHGGQGTTFAGTDRKTGRRVAVKVFDLKTAADWKRVELFEREVKTLQRLSHPATPRFIDLLEDDDAGVKALVMSYIPGQSLARHLKSEGPMLEQELWRVTLDISDVLTALHGEASPVVHRDIKPDNLVRRPDGTIALVDFGGVGRARGAAGSTVVGTFGYMAPEQLYGTSTPATDIYALGATLLTLATGLEPEDQPRKGLRIDVDKAAKHLSPPLRDLIHRMLAPEPEDRPADARELAKELEQIATGDTDKKQKKRKRERERQKRDPKVKVVDPDDPSTEAHWPEGPEADLDEVTSFVGGAVSLAVGILGTIGIVLVGEILLPLVLSILAGFASPSGKRKLEAARAQVREAAKTGRKGFERSIHGGASTLKEVDHRKTRRRVTGKERKGRPRGRRGR